MADAPDLGSGTFQCVGSSPILRTNSPDCKSPFHPALNCGTPGIIPSQQYRLSMQSRQFTTNIAGDGKMFISPVFPRPLRKFTFTLSGKQIRLFSHHSSAARNRSLPPLCPEVRQFQALYPAFRLWPRFPPHRPRNRRFFPPPP